MNKKTEKEIKKEILNEIRRRFEILSNRYNVPTAYNMMCGMCNVGEIMIPYVEILRVLYSMEKENEPNNRRTTKHIKRKNTKNH